MALISGNTLKIIVHILLAWEVLRSLGLLVECIVV